MSARRPFADVVVELTESLAADQMPRELFRVTRLDVELPVEVALVWSGDEIQFVADVPRWRWRTPFDRETGRLTLRIGEGVPA